MRSLRHSFEQCSCRRVDRHLQRFGNCHPAELDGFVIQFHVRLPDTTAGVVQENEVSVAIKLFRVDAILDEDESDVGDVEVGFLLEFATERGFGGFAPFSFAAGNAPEIRPLMGADH